MTSTVQSKDVREFVVTTLVQEMNLFVDTDALTDDSPIGTGGIDLESLSLVELMLRLEREYDVKIPDSDIEAIGSMTLGQLVDDVLKRTASAA